MDQVDGDGEGGAAAVAVGEGATECGGGQGDAAPGAGGASGGVAKGVADIDGSRTRMTEKRSSGLNISSAAAMPLSGKKERWIPQDRASGRPAYAVRISMSKSSSGVIRIARLANVDE